MMHKSLISDPCNRLLPVFFLFLFFSFFFFCYIRSGVNFMSKAKNTGVSQKRPNDAVLLFIKYTQVRLSCAEV